MATHQHLRFGRYIDQKESGASWWQIPIACEKLFMGKAGGSAREYNLSRQMSGVSSCSTLKIKKIKKNGGDIHTVPLSCLYFWAQSSYI